MPVFPTASSEPLGTPLVPRRLLLLGMCPVHTLLQAFPEACHVDHMLWESMPHSAVPEVDLGSYDAVIIGLTLRHIMFAATSPSEGHWSSDVLWTRLVGTDKTRDYFDSCADALRTRLEPFRAWAERRPLLFLSFIEPREQPLGLLMPRYSLDNPAWFVRQLNKTLEEALTDWGNAWFVEVNEVLNTIGRQRVHDDYVNHFSHAAYMFDEQVEHERDRQRIQRSTPPSLLYDTADGVREAARALVSRIFDVLKILAGADPIKLIIIDLDDTLWRGIAADEPREVWGDTEGWPLGFAEALLVFKARGGLLAIVSKNEEEPTRERLKSVHGGRLDAADFASVKINFEPKSRNVAEILAEVNILPANALFIDDNPREIDEVQRAFPDIRVLSREHYDWRRRILTAPETQVARLSQESARRTENVQALIAREQERQVLSRDEWLESLELVQHHHLVRDTTDSHFARAFELLNKTNQFNTTGRRWTHGEIAEHFAQGGTMLCAFLRDRMVDNGLIGVTLISAGQIVQAVLSCRVFGLGAEHAMLSAATAIALEKGGRVTGTIVGSGRNFTSQSYFGTAGFTDRGDGVFDTEHVISRPPHVRLGWTPKGLLTIARVEATTTEAWSVLCSVTNRSDTLWQFGGGGLGLAWRIAAPESAQEACRRRAGAVSEWCGLLEPGKTALIHLAVPQAVVAAGAEIVLVDGSAPDAYAPGSLSVAIPAEKSRGVFRSVLQVARRGISRRPARTG